MRFLLIIALLCSLSLAQTVKYPSSYVCVDGHDVCSVPAPTVRPFVQAGISFNGSSETTLSKEVMGGVDIEAKRFLVRSFASYNTVRKDAPGISPTSHGRKRELGTDAFYRKGNWHYGAGALFLQEAITEYTKQSLFGLVGGGHDFQDTRIQLMYLKAFNDQTRYPDGRGCQCTNGVQGFRFNIWIPNPSDEGHIFLAMNLTGVWFHMTVTDPSNATLTAAQKSQHSVDSTAKIELMYRF